MKKFFVIAASLLIGFSAFAQESNKDGNGNTQWGPYETNTFFDNTFINIGGGANFAVKDANFKNAGNYGIAVQADFGKWFTPEYGARIGWRGLKNQIKGYESNIDKFNFAKADFLWNASNAFAGYKETRFWDFVPFLGAGVLFTSPAAAYEYGAEAGIINNLRLGDRVDLNVELGTIVGKQQPYLNTGRFILFPYATAGLQFNLGKTGWTRRATTVASYAAAVAAAEAAANAAKAGKDAADAAKNAADAKAKALADENAKLKNELAAASAQAGDYSALFEEPIIAYFKIGSAKISTQEKAHIAYAVKNIISRGENVKFTLAGNADSKTGTARRNMQLSQQRADAVYKLMTEELGIDGSRFTVKANGGNDVFDTPELNRAVFIEKQ